jgi:hypothetical protein
MAGLNDGAAAGFKQATRLGGSPSLGVFAQQGRFRSAAVAPTVRHNASERQQASLTNGRPGVKAPVSPVAHADSYRMQRALADLGVRIMLGLEGGAHG